jgi:hypothetical protein
MLHDETLEHFARFNPALNAERTPLKIVEWQVVAAATALGKARLKSLPLNAAILRDE